CVRHVTLLLFLLPLWLICIKLPNSFFSANVVSVNVSVSVSVSLVLNPILV
ncbi:unnamed protein product, partial [Brassica oleracea var. botrytis]